MIKLYKYVNGTLHYAETWASAGTAVVHTGTVGDRGEASEHPCPDEDAFFAAFTAEWEKQGYAPFDADAMHWLVFQWPTATFEGTADDLALRDLATQVLGEHLGWLGLGEVDGWEMGRSFADPEQFVLNLYCLVVDDRIAVRSFLAAKPPELDFARLKIATLPCNDEDADYTLVYSANPADTDFSL